MATKLPENYDYEAVIGYPCPPPVIGYSTNTRQRITTQIEKAVCTKGVIITTIVLIIVVLVVSVLTCPYNPQFQVNSALVSAFNGSSPTMNLDVEFSVRNPNKGRINDIFFGRALALLSYQEEALSAASIPAFLLKIGNATTVNVKFAVLSTHVSNQNTRKGLAFDMKVIGPFYYRGDKYREPRTIFCKDILFEYSSKSQARPKKCHLMIWKLSKNKMV